MSTDAQPMARPTTRRRSLDLRSALAGALAVWLATGLAGAVLYGQRYALYRGFPPPPKVAAADPGRTTSFSFYAPAIHARTTCLVHLPPGYARGVAAGRRYGVLYVLHGHPGSARDILDAGDIGADLDAMVLQHRIAPMIVVLPEGNNGPEGGGDTEWADTPAGRYDALVPQIVHAVDARFATRADRTGRVLAGLSSGAYAAVNVGLHHVGVFGNVESWSGYFVQDRSGVFAHATRAQLAAQSPALYVQRLSPAIHRLGLRAFLYVGRADHPSRLDELGPFAAKLRAAGAHVGVAEYPGAHDWALWRWQMPHMLRLASGWLSAGRSGP